MAGAELMAVSVEESDSSISFGPATGLFTVSGDPREYAVSSDGRFLMPLATEERSPEPITVVLDWAARLED